jgi:hypothetical protein
MKKLLLILTIFLSFVSFGQDKVGHGSDAEGCDSAGVGTVTTWVKRVVPPEHDTIPFLYQFDLTADEYITENINYLGYDNGLYCFGVISPQNDTIVSLMWKFPNDPHENSLWLELFDYDLGSVVDSVFIDNDPIMSYLTLQFYQTWKFTGLSNPFVDGETYNIRIYGKYEY